MVKLVLYVVPYSRTVNGFVQVAPKFAVADIDYNLVHCRMHSSYPLPSKFCFLVWVWEGLSGGYKAGLTLKEVTPTGGPHDPAVSLTNDDSLIVRGRYRQDASPERQRDR